MVNNRGRGERGVSREAQHGWLESLEQSSWETLDQASPGLGDSTYISTYHAFSSHSTSNLVYTADIDLHMFLVECIDNNYP